MATTMERTVVVIEDDQGCSDLIAELVQDLGYRVLIHDRAEAAFTQVLKQQPSLVVLDVMLSDGDGLNVLRDIRQEPRTREIPVLLCTAALSDLSGRQEQLKDGRTEIVTKPFHIEQFTTALHQLLPAD